MLRSLIKKIIPKLFFCSVKNKIVVLTYHRIDEVITDPWGLSVSPENFEAQLKVLTANFKVISLDELNRQVKSKKIENNQVLITFDDGYADNYINAKPLLEKYNCPAVFFIPTSYIGQSRLFWDNELNNIILQSKTLPKTLQFEIDGKAHIFNLEKEIFSDAELDTNKSWSTELSPANERCDLYLRLWNLLRPLPQFKIDAVIAHIRSWANYSHAGGNEFPMTLSQLKDLSKHKLFDIGIHTHTHAALGLQNEEVQYQEIKTCKDELECNLNIPITSIAYPYGSYNKSTIAIAGDLKLALGFSTKARSIKNNKNIYALGRFKPLNWTGEVFNKQVKNWFYYSLF